MTGLEHLDVDRNALASLQPLAALSRLTHVSLAHNRVASLAPLAPLPALVELFAPHNSIASAQRVAALAAAPALLVLDVRGNSAVAGPGARDLLVFRLPRLRVLDGVAVTAACVAAARARYAGRLTLEWLEDTAGRAQWHRCVQAALSALLARLWRSPPSCAAAGPRALPGGDSRILSARERPTARACRVQELDLAGVRMRDLGSAFAAASWASLTSLDVSRNLLVSLAPLRHLPALRILNASCNRLAACPGPIFDTHATANADGTAIAQAAPPGEGGGHGGGPLLPCLEVLQVGDNALADLEALQLARLPALRSLFLQGNALTRLEGVAGLPRLQELVRHRPRLR